ncbi:3621_t:CDS:2, partial [Funneliformis geosporum]
MSTIFKDINNLPFDDNEKADLLDFFTNKDTTKVEEVLATIEKVEVKVKYLRKHAKSLRDEHQGDDYFYTDEDAKRFWNALKDKNVE